MRYQLTEPHLPSIRVVSDGLGVLPSVRVVSDGLGVLPSVRVVSDDLHVLPSVRVVSDNTCGCERWSGGITFR